jgi:trehalose-6-phosphatase
MFIHDLYKMINKVLEKEAPNTEIIYGNGYLEVKPRDIKKKQLINLLLQKISKNSKIDFIFYLGNDSEDEAVFEFLKSERANADFFA